jgi:hypothetical protein
MGRSLVGDRAAMDGAPLIVAPFPDQHRAFRRPALRCRAAMAGHGQPFGLMVMALRP